MLSAQDLTERIFSLGVRLDVRTSSCTLQLQELMGRLKIFSFEFVYLLKSLKTF